MMRMRTCAAFFATIAIACTDATEPAVPSSEQTDTASGVAIDAPSSRGTFVARITPDVDPIPMNEPFAVTLELIDGENDSPFTDYDAVTLDARMPAHRHGMLRDVDVVERNGVLRAEGLLMHMIGHWEIHVDVTRGAHIERAQASVHLTH